MKKEVIHFHTLYAAGEKYYLQERVKADGVITELRLKFNPGQEMELHVWPYVMHKGHKKEDFITFVEYGYNYLAGDNDYLIYPVQIEVKYDDMIIIEAENTSTMYDYSLFADVVVQYSEFEGDME